MTGNNHTSLQYSHRSQKQPILETSYHEQLEHTKSADSIYAALQNVHTSAIIHLLAQGLLSQTFARRSFCPIRGFHFAAVVTTPSYSLDAMYSNVRWKCRLGWSMVADSWFVWRLEWMSSMRPFRYFVVTCTCISSV
jgi:hypothetical protein